MASANRAKNVTIELSRVARHLWTAIGMGAIVAIAIVRLHPAIGQQVGDRIGDACRIVALDDRTNLYLYERPVLLDFSTNESTTRERNLEPNATPNTAPNTEPQLITQLFDRERIALHGIGLRGVDGDRNLWHEIEDSLGNRGYMLAIDPTTGRSALRNCP